MEVYELIPTGNQKSFYGKALVIWEPDSGTRTLISYGTKIMRINPDGSMVRFFDEWTHSVGTHIKAFSGLTKEEFFDLQKVV